MSSEREEEYPGALQIRLANLLGAFALLCVLTPIAFYALFTTGTIPHTPLLGRSMLIGGVICGVLSLCWIPAFILAHVGRRTLRHEWGSEYVERKAMPGVVAGCLTIVCYIVALCVMYPRARTSDELMCAHELLDDFTQIEKAVSEYSPKYHMDWGDTVSFSELAEAGCFEKASDLADGKPSGCSDVPANLNYNEFLTQLSPYRRLDIPMEYRELCEPAVEPTNSIWGHYPPLPLPERTTNQILLAIRDANWTVFSELLEGGADPSTADGNGWTALMFTAFLGHDRPREEFAEELLRRGAKTNIRDLEGYTALMYAAKNGHTKIIEMLLDHGADCSLAHAETGKTAMMMAIESRPQDVDSATLLIERELHLNRTDKDGETAMHIAARGGGDKIVATLIAHGADINAADVLGDTPLHIAIRSHQPAPFRTLIRSGADINAVNNLLDTPLHAAAGSGELGAVAMLVQLGVDKNARNSKGQTPLHLAALDGEERSVRHLIEKGADINARDNTQSTPFLNAVLRRRPIKLLQYMLDRCAEMNVRDERSGDTPLSIAVERDDLRLVQLLLDYKADLSVTDRDGKSMLEIAKSDQMKQLLRAGGLVK